MHNGKHIKICREIDIPDWMKLERFRKVPELGPRILFFCGGTALKPLSQKLVNYTHNSIHLITPFDSGGSSAKIRDAFNMLSVGDLRNRILALADQSIKGTPQIYKLFSYRISKNISPKEQKKKLTDLALGKDNLIESIRLPMRQIICHHIQYFLDHMPDDFDLAGANIGNIVITGGYLNNNKDIDSVLFLFSKLVEVRGLVKAIDDAYFHLVTELEDGTVHVGQHLMTGKEHAPIQSKVARVYLSVSKDNLVPVEMDVRDDIRKLISKADVICYPMGSFYSSVVAGLLPNGVAEAIAASSVPKIYIPNSFPDPEQFGMTLHDSVETLLSYIAKDTGISTDKLLDFVLVDTAHGTYPKPLDIDKIEQKGIAVIDTDLITSASYPAIDSQQLLEILLSFA